MSDERLWEESLPEPNPASWGDGYRAGYAQAMADARARLLEVAEWCAQNGFSARARHTRSAAMRVRDEAHKPWCLTQDPCDCGAALSNSEDKR